MLVQSDPKRGWSKSVNGLQIQLVMPEGKIKIGDSVKFTLKFRNCGSENIRIYIVNSEPFRFGQSTLTVLSKDGKDLITTQPIPHPHGIVIGEEDFHLINPGKFIEFYQNLILNDYDFSEPGEYILKWQYKNDVKRWSGGVKTLDGITNRLFRGKDITFIWSRELEVKKTIKVVGKD